jgi:hypothetical protein
MGHTRGGGALIKVFEAMRSGDVYLVPTVRHGVHSLPVGCFHGRVSLI